MFNFLRTYNSIIKKKTCWAVEAQIQTLVWEKCIFQFFKCANLCCTITWPICLKVEKVRQSSWYICVFPEPSTCPTLLASSQSAEEASETLLYEKWSSTSFFSITLSVTRRLESEGGALWRRHSSSGHLYRSCNLHQNNTSSEWGEIISFCTAQRINKTTNYFLFRWGYVYLMQMNNWDKRCHVIFIHSLSSIFDRTVQASLNKII